MNPDFESAFGNGLDKINDWVEGLVRNTPNILAALLLLLLSIGVARLVRRGLRITIRRVVQHGGLARLITGVVYVGIIAIGLIVALSILNLDDTVTAILAGAGIAGLAVGLAFQESAQNFISGVFITLREPFRPGDIIGSNEFLGTVERVTMRATELRTFQGQKVYLPNKQVFNEALVNYNDIGRRRIDLKVGISYGDDLERARAVAIQALEPLRRDRDRPVELFYEGFGESSIDFEIHFWIPFTGWPDFLAARSEAVIAIKRAFDENDITIPFPIRTIELHGRVPGLEI